MWLFTSYEMRLPKALLVKDVPEAVVVETGADGWWAEIRLMANARAGRIKRADGYYYLVPALEITVNHREEMFIEMEDIRETFARYEAAAIDFVWRLTLFMHLRSKHSLFEAIEQYEQMLAADDLDRSGPELLPGFKKPTKIQRVDDQLPMWLPLYLLERFDEELVELLLDEVAVSMENNRYRRAVLELAMACEAVLGLRVFRANLARATIGAGFKVFNSEAYDDLCDLFVQRDEAYQQGGGVFKFNREGLKEVRREQLQSWLESIQVLKDWLSGADLGEI